MSLKAISVEKCAFFAEIDLSPTLIWPSKYKTQKETKNYQIMIRSVKHRPSIGKKSESRSNSPPFEKNQPPEEHKFKFLEVFWDFSRHHEGSQTADPLLEATIDGVVSHAHIAHCAHCTGTVARLSTPHSNHPPASLRSTLPPCRRTHFNPRILRTARICLLLTVAEAIPRKISGRLARAQS